jgi:hypothetical protein
VVVTFLHCTKSDSSRPRPHAIIKPMVISCITATTPNSPATRSATNAERAAPCQCPATRSTTDAERAALCQGSASCSSALKSLKTQSSCTPCQCTLGAATCSPRFRGRRSGRAGSRRRRQGSRRGQLRRQCRRRCPRRRHGRRWTKPESPRWGNLWRWLTGRSRGASD